MRRLALLLLLTATANAAEINVYAAASLTEAVQEIGVAYERANPADRVVFNFGGSSMLARQIQEGAPADLFISADEEKMNALQRAGLVEAASRVSLLSNVLVIVTPKNTPPLTPADLATDRVKMLALADPRSVPAGIYAQTWLQRIGVWSAVKRKVVPTENVRGALSAVEAGNADAAIVYKTDAMHSRGVAVAYTVNGKERPSISYPFAVMLGAPDRVAARRFLAYLSSKPALDVFRRHGFEILRKK